MSKSVHHTVNVLHSSALTGVCDSERCACLFKTDMMEFLASRPSNVFVPQRKLEQVAVYVAWLSHRKTQAEDFGGVQGATDDRSRLL